MTMARVTYHKAWEKRLIAAGAFLEPANDIAKRTERKLNAGGGDVPANEYADGLRTEQTDKGARVLTDGSRAHLVEWGSIYRQPESPMRSSAAEVGRIIS